MLALSTALAGGETSNEFETSHNTTLWVRLYGNFAGNTITMQESVDGSSYATFTDGTTDQTFTASGYKAFDVPGGVKFRFSMNGSGGDVDIHIAGGGVSLL